MSSLLKRPPVFLIIVIVARYANLVYKYTVDLGCVGAGGVHGCAKYFDRGLSESFDSAWLRHIVRSRRQCISELLLPQSGEISDERDATYLVRYELAVFPARPIMTVSDPGRERARKLDNAYCDFCSAQGPRNIQVPADKIWGSKAE